MDSEEKNRIEKLKSKIYSRQSDAVLDQNEKKERSKEYFNVAEEWQEENMKKNNKTSLSKIILILSIVFFLISVAVGSYMFFWGNNTISTRNIDVSVEMPSNISAGEVFEMTILVRNRNNINMEAADLKVDFPEGFRDPENLNSALSRYVESLGSIPPEGMAERKMDLVIFGEENTIKELKASVEYRVAGSSARFFREEVKKIILSSSPVLVEVDYSPEINSGQEVEFVFDISSNSTTPISNLLLIAEYPFGFTFSSSDPAPTFGDSVWRIGDLESEAKTSLTLKGSIEGLDHDERTFRFNFGTPREQDGLDIVSNLLSLAETITIKKPFIDVNLSLDGNRAPEFVSLAGRVINGSINWVNNLPDNMINAEVEVRISGNALDRFSIFPGQGGFFRSTENRIIWDKNSTPSLARINPNQSINLNFAFSTFGSQSDVSFGLVNPTVDIEVIVRGTQLSETGAPTNVESRVTKKVKISTDVNFKGEVFFSSGPFKNTGPLPPKVDQETTYTVSWNLSNNFNNVSDISVKANLPPYVEWLGLINPTNEDIVYNPDLREVVWNPGILRAGAGYTFSDKQVSFQVSVVPSSSQVGSVIQVLNRTTINGTDDFAGIKIDMFNPALTTDIKGDSSYFFGIGNVSR